MTDNAPLSRDEINEKYGSVPVSTAAPRNPWARALVGLVGLALSAILMLIGMTQFEPILYAVGGALGTWSGLAVLLWLFVRALIFQQPK